MGMAAAGLPAATVVSPRGGLTDPAGIFIFIFMIHIASKCEAFWSRSEFGPCQIP